MDLATQHLYFYKDGKVIIDSPFVSGNVSKNYTTPPGLFELYYKQTDRVLKGEDYATPVKYWMPFNGGIGLHDANWRSKVRRYDLPDKWFSWLHQSAAESSSAGL